MVFWESCFRHTYHAFTDRYQSGEADILWWLVQADDRHLLPWANLTPGALCAVTAVAGESNQVGTKAWNQLQSCRLTEQELGLQCVSFERQNHSEAIGRFVMNRMDPARASLGLIAIRALYTSRVTEFISRFYLINSETPFEIAGQVVSEAFRRWNQAGQASFDTEVAMRALLKMPRLHPETVPAVLPDWLSDADQEEQTFLRRTLVLERKERLILFLTIYGAFTPWEIAPAVSSLTRNWAPREIESLLKAAWRNAFAVL